MVIMHGMHKGGKFIEALDEIKEFVNKNKGEFVTIKISEEKNKNMEPEIKKYLVEYLALKFQGECITH